MRKLSLLSSFLAWVGSLPIALVPFFSIFASSLANRFGCRTVSVTGCMAFALSLVTASLAKNLTVLYVAFSVIGIGASCALVSGLVMVRKCFDKREAFALGIVSTGQGLGTMVLSQVLQYLTDAVGWRSTLQIMAGALVLNALLALLFDSKVDTENSESGEQLSSEEDGQRRKSKRFTFHCSVWKVPGVIALTITGVFFMFGRSIIYVLVVGSSTPLTIRMRDPNMCVIDQVRSRWILAEFFTQKIRGLYTAILTESLVNNRLLHNKNILLYY